MTIYRCIGERNNQTIIILTGQTTPISYKMCTIITIFSVSCTSIRNNATIQLFIHVTYTWKIKYLQSEKVPLPESITVIKYLLLKLFICTLYEMIVIAESV